MYQEMFDKDISHFELLIKSDNNLKLYNRYTTIIKKKKRLE